MLGVYALGESYLGEGPASFPALRTGRILILARIFLDSGTENVAGVPVKHPTRFYEARVLNWGSIQRSIPVPAGLPQVGDARIRIADTDFAFRDLFADASPPQTPLERLVEIRIAREGEPESWGIVVYTGEIVEFDFGDMYCELAIRDITFSWLDEEWPGTLDNGIYAPTIFGRCIQNSNQEQHGLIPLPHIGFDLSIGDRWIVAWHTVNDIIAVHRHNLNGTWEIVDPSEYSITEDDVLIGGILTTGTYIDFTNPQDDGIEIRIDVEGWNVRPAWGSLGAATGLLRNPIDFFINIVETVQTKIGRTLSFDTTAIGALRTVLETAVDTSPPRAYYCDGAILEPITLRSLLSRFMTSFNLDLFQTVNGDISLSFMHETNPSRRVLTETLEILEGSLRQTSPTAPINRLKCKMARNYAVGEWSIEQLHDNTADQTKLGTALVPKIKAADLELWFVRDRFTAASVAARRAGFLTLTSYDQEFDLPIEVAAERELCEQVGLTTVRGLAGNGFVNQEVRVDGLTLSLDEYRARGYSRIWREQAADTPSFVTYELDGDITLTSAVDGEVEEVI